MGIIENEDTGELVVIVGRHLARASLRPPQSADRTGDEHSGAR